MITGRFATAAPAIDERGDPVLPPNAWWCCVCRFYNHVLLDVCPGCGIDLSDDGEDV